MIRPPKTRGTCWRYCLCGGASCESKATNKTTPAGQRYCSIPLGTRLNTASAKSCLRRNEWQPFSSNWRLCFKHTEKRLLQRKATGMFQINELTQGRRGAKRMIPCTSAPLREIILVFAAGIAVAGASGCRSHAWLRRSGGDPPPIAFSALPSPTEAVSAVNANTARVQSLQTQGASVSIPGAPSVGADIAIERPRRLRMRAKTQLLGPELDLGSNDELFWLWAARMPDSSVFFARHDQFAPRRARHMLAVEPA